MLEFVQLDGHDLQRAQSRASCPPGGLCRSISYFPASHTGVFFQRLERREGGRDFFFSTGVRSHNRPFPGVRSGICRSAWYSMALWPFPAVLSTNSSCWESSCLGASTFKSCRGLAARPEVRFFRRKAEFEARVIVQLVKLQSLPGNDGGRGRSPASAPGTGCCSAYFEAEGIGAVGFVGKMELHVPPPHRRQKRPSATKAAW